MEGGREGKGRERGGGAGDRRSGRGPKRAEEGKKKKILHPNSVGVEVDGKKKPESISKKRKLYLVRG